MQPKNLFPKINLQDLALEKIRAQDRSDLTANFFIYCLQRSYLHEKAIDARVTKNDLRHFGEMNDSVVSSRDRPGACIRQLDVMASYEIRIQERVRTARR